MSESKKYNEMTYEEFITEVLEIKLSKEQQHLVRLFDENKVKKVEYINTYPSYPIHRDPFPSSPTVYYTSECSTTNRPIDDLKLNRINEIKSNELAKDFRTI